MFWGCTSGLVMAVGIAEAGETVVGDRPQPFSVPVMIVNEAAVPATVLAYAEMEAARIYQQFGVDLVWVDDAVDDHEYLFIIKVVAKAFPRNEVDTKAMGVSPGSGDAGGKMAYAFYERIRMFSDIHRVAISPILGSVIAHELGHLLLPRRAHSRVGLMSSRWDAERAVLAAKGLMIFSSRESTLIRNRLSIDNATIARRRPSQGVALRTHGCGRPRV